MPCMPASWSSFDFKGNLRTTCPLNNRVYIWVCTLRLYSGYSFSLTSYSKKFALPACPPSQVENYHTSQVKLLKMQSWETWHSQCQKESLPQLLGYWLTNYLLGWCLGFWGCSWFFSHMRVLYRPSAYHKNLNKNIIPKIPKCQPKKKYNPTKTCRVKQAPGFLPTTLVFDPLPWLWLRYRPNDARASPTAHSMSWGST